MKKTIILIFISISFIFIGCTKQGIRNKALVLSVEKFDNEAQSAGKAHFVDLEQQKIFAEFIKSNTKIDVDNVELQNNDEEATARLIIDSFSKNLYTELPTISGREWKEKVKAARETKTYTLKLKKTKDIWQITNQTELQK